MPFGRAELSPGPLFVPRTSEKAPSRRFAEEGPRVLLEPVAALEDGVERARDHRHEQQRERAAQDPP